MPTWRDEIAKMTPAQIRERNREVYRVEVGQPGVKWRMFQEQCRKEQRGLACLENKARAKPVEPSPVVEAVLKRVRYMADRRVKRCGGQASSNIRQTFLHWDRSNSGILTTESLIGALSQVGVPVTRQEAEEVMKHYSEKDTDGVDKSLWQIPHARLLRDATKGAPGLLEFDRSVTERLMGSARSHASLLGVSKMARDETAMIRAFRAKLRKMIDKRVRHSGGSPGRILKSLFLNWDTERNGALDTRQLRGALRTLDMRLSATQAKEVSRFYAKDGNAAAGCDFAVLVEDVCGYDQGPFVHPSPKKQPSEAEEEEDWEKTSAPTARTGEDSVRSPISLHFTARPHNKPSNRVVDRFKMRLRDALERTIKRKGGVSHAIIREAFLDWDADASGKLDPRELRGALKRMGVHMTQEEADAAVCYYDLDGTGEMSYETLCEEIKVMSHPMLSYIEEVDVLEGLDRTVREPPLVTKALGTIRAGVKAALQRSSPPPRRDLFAPAGRTAAVAFPPISPRDLLEGTCLRFDTTHDRGVLGVEDLRQVWRELRINVRTSETKALVAWFDRSTTKTLHAADLCDAVFGADAAKASCYLGTHSRQPLPPPPRQPHAIQAQKSAALASGESSCSFACPPRLPARVQEDIHGAPERRRQRRQAEGSGKVAWNWQGRRGSSAAAAAAGGATRKKVRGNSDTTDKLLRGGRWGGDEGSGGGPVRYGGVLQAGGEAVVAEKARIEKRLKELQRERALLLRDKNGLGGRCWEDGGRRAGSPIAPANRCGG